MSKNPIRIAGVQGFYGDSPMGAISIVSAHAADILVHDALAELTLSILQKDRMQDPDLGYARDIELHAKMFYPTALQQSMRIVTNAGGLNPKAAGKKVKEILSKMGLSEVKIAVIDGDDVLSRLNAFQSKGILLEHLENQQPFRIEAFPVTHANVYVGGQKVKEALDQGAQIVITGRVADPCLTLGALSHHFQWALEDATSQHDLDLLAQGITIGHLLECGGQASGGNSYAEWPMDYEVYNLGYPIAEVHADGTAYFSKLSEQGGLISRNTLREQLVYEIHDPSHYITPDVVVDLTGIHLETAAPGRVKCYGAKGKPRPKHLKLTLGRHEGFLSEQFFFFSWPYAWEKAQKFRDAVEKIWQNLPFPLDQTRFQWIGINGIHEDAAPMPDPEFLAKMNEIGIRCVVKHKDEKTGKLAMGAITCLGLNGPPGVNAMPGWGKINRMLLSLWPTLIPREEIQLQINWY